MKFVFLFILGVYSYGVSLSDEAKEGREYYLEAKCQKCHFQDSNFVQKGDDAPNIKRLKFWVTSCNTFFRASWFPEDEDLVVKYLNEIHYKHKK